MRRNGMSLGVLGFVVIACGGGASDIKAPTSPDPTTFKPTRSIHLRAAFDDDPTGYVGRFIPDALALEDVDENAAAQTRCSEFFVPKVVNTNQEMDEVVYTSQKAAAFLGIPLVASIGGSHGTEGEMRIKYTLKKRLQVNVKDPAALDRCCKAQPDQCTGKVIGEFLMGSGQVYQFYGKSDKAGGNGTYQGVTGDIEYKDDVAWKRVNSFKDMYFAFLTTAVTTGGGAAQAAASNDDSCGWCDNLPSSLDGKSFCGVSPDVISESMARDMAMRNAREQVIQYVGEYISSQSSSTSSAVKGYLQDTQVVNAMAAGIASQVKDQKWCKPERTDSPNGKLYKSKVLAYFPNGDTRDAARTALQTVLQTKKLTPDEQKNVHGLLDGMK